MSDGKENIQKPLVNKISGIEFEMVALQGFIEALNQTMLETKNIECKPCRAIFYTAYGMVEGDICKKSVDSKNMLVANGDKITVDIFSIESFKKDFLKKLESKNSVVTEFENNAITIHLRNVKITFSSGMKSETEQMFLFANQIIGYSITNY